MVDQLGWRCKFAVIVPSTNTVVQPEYDDMRVPGVTNHIARMHIPDAPIKSDAELEELVRRIDVALEEALERALTAKPDHVILGVSAESFWGGGLEPSRRIAARVRRLAGELGVTQAADAIPAALKAYGIKERIAVVTPYRPSAEPYLREFIAAIGYRLVAARHLSCESPTLIAHVSEDELREALQAVDGHEVEAIVQFGTNVPALRLAAEAERWLKKPVIAINAATYWHALRSRGIADRKPGLGKLLTEF